MKKTDTSDATQEWIGHKENMSALQSMSMHDIKTLLLPTEDPEEAVTINILRVMDGWIYWSDETSLNTFVPDRRYLDGV